MGQSTSTRRPWCLSLRRHHPSISVIDDLESLGGHPFGPRPRQEPRPTTAPLPSWWTSCEPPAPWRQALWAPCRGKTAAGLRSLPDAWRHAFMAGFVSGRQIGVLVARNQTQACGVNVLPFGGGDHLWLGEACGSTTGLGTLGRDRVLAFPGVLSLVTGPQPRMFVSLRFRSEGAGRSQSTADAW